MIGLVGGDGEGPAIICQHLDVRSAVLLAVAGLVVDCEEVMQHLLLGFRSAANGVVPRLELASRYLFGVWGYHKMSPVY